MTREIKFCDSRIFNVNGRIRVMLFHASLMPFIRPVCYMKTFYNKLSVSKIIHNKLLCKHKIITYYIYKSCPKITIKFMQCKSLQLLYILKKKKILKLFFEFIITMDRFHFHMIIFCPPQSFVGPLSKDLPTQLARWRYPNLVTNLLINIQ